MNQEFLKTQQGSNDFLNASDGVKCTNCMWSGVQKQLIDNKCPECSSDDVWDIHALYDDMKDDKVNNEEISTLTNEELINEFEKLSSNLGRVGLARTDFIGQRFLTIVEIMQKRGLNVDTSNANMELLVKTRGLGLHIFHCLSDLKDSTPSHEKAILANCTSKIFLKNKQ